MTDVTANNAKLLGIRAREKGLEALAGQGEKKLYVPKSSTCHRNGHQWFQSNGAFLLNYQSGGFRLFQTLALHL